jgi:hypothetical protein
MLKKIVARAMAFIYRNLKHAKWDDGYVLYTDPRREDPLYYYMRERGWGSAVGFEVAPLYEEHAAIRVSIRVWSGHLQREADMNTAVRRDMYHRVVSSLLQRFPNWSNVTLQSIYLPEITEQGLVSSAFTEAGFSRSMSTTNQETWTKK